MSLGESKGCSLLIPNTENTFPQAPSSPSVASLQVVEKQQKAFFLSPPFL